MNINKLSKIYKIASSCSSDLLYHISNGLTLDKNIFRPGSDKFLNLFMEVKKLVEDGSYEPSKEESYYLNTDIGEKSLFNGVLVPLDLPMEYDDSDINNAEYQGKDVELNKPKRGGSKKFYVYVKDGDKVKKVSFGDPGSKTNISDPEARSSFKARHNCEEKNDKTTAGYWSCRIARYPNISGSDKKYTWW